MIENSLTIRRAEISDAGVLATLDALIFAAAAYSYASWRDEIANPAGEVLLGESTGQAVAFLSLLRSGEECEIRKIGVSPEVRRQGIARRLIEYSLPADKKHRCLIDVSDKNAGGVAFYQSLGFRELTRRKKYYADGSDAIVMERTIHQK
ncbi:MAG: GNAT family N-acetyltransferase [Spirochaetes bacterium]|nr:GNAT family N-acetyltransferase [Spirochaetota bacterium]